MKCEWLSILSCINATKDPCQNFTFSKVNNSVEIMLSDVNLSEKLYSQENPTSIFTLLAHRLGGWKAAWNLPRILQAVVWQLQEESKCNNCLLENSWFSSSTWILFGKLWRREKEALPRNSSWFIKHYSIVFLWQGKQLTNLGNGDESIHTQCTHHSRASSSIQLCSSWS